MPTCWAGGSVPSPQRVGAALERASRRPCSSLRAFLFSLALTAGASCPRSIQVTPICAAPGHPPRPRPQHTSSVAALASRGTGWNTGAVAESSACQATGQMGLLPSRHTWLPFLPHLPASCLLLVPGRVAAQHPLGGSLLTLLTTPCHLFPDSGSVSVPFQHVPFCLCCLFLVFCFTFSLCEAH